MKFIQIFILMLLSSCSALNASSSDKDIYSFFAGGTWDQNVSRCNEKCSNIKANTYHLNSDGSVNVDFRMENRPALNFGSWQVQNGTLFIFISDGIGAVAYVEKYKVTSIEKNTVSATNLLNNEKSIFSRQI